MAAHPWHPLFDEQQQLEIRGRHEKGPLKMQMHVQVCIGQSEAVLVHEIGQRKHRHFRVSIVTVHQRVSGYLGSGTFVWMHLSMEPCAQFKDA